jgi:predicted phage baseplate assembly protein
VVLEGAQIALAGAAYVVVRGERSDLPGAVGAEVRGVDGVAIAGARSTLRLHRALDHAYVLRSVTVNANVAPADHGERIPHPPEVLGSGDATRPFQRFTLAQPPLTYVADPSPAGARSTLEVRVDGVRWDEVASFLDAGADDRVYVTSTGDDARTTVTFGDGVHGARLPTGQANVVATYRRGIGAAGLVRANQLSQLGQRPLGVRAATNPLAAAGAADPERLEDARRNATLGVTTLGRVVSLGDYEAFARAFAGIDKAAATWTWSGERRVVLLTVAGVHGADVPEGSALQRDLLAAIAACSEPGVAVRLSSYTPVAFRVVATIGVRPERDAAAVARAVEAALCAEFSFAARAFGQPVHRSEVLAAMQGVEGVVHVELLAFHRAGAAPSVEEAIPAAAPQAGEEGISPAELVALDPRLLELRTTR